MIPIKSFHEIESMRKACRITAAALAYAGEKVAPGVTTQEIDRHVREFILAQGARPSFLHYNGFPASACISVNEEIIHGIPGPRKLKDGDIVSIDVGACFEGFNGDCANTFAVGKISEDAQRLIDVTRQCFLQGVEFARAGNRVPDISRAIQQYAESNGFSLVREYTGHGVGAKLHEEPEVPNFVSDDRWPRPRLYEGMTIAIEPMVNMGGPQIHVLKNKWTVVTADKKLSAHYENTVLITAHEPEILTVC